MPTRTLTLLRHAKSSWSDPVLRDFDRPLNKRGQRDAPEMGRRLKGRGIRPSLIVTSPAVRALATARAVAEALGYPDELIQLEPGLYHASPDAILRIVAAQDDAHRHILVCGHNPGLTDLASRLVGTDVGNLPTAAVLSVAGDAEDWAAFPYCALELAGFDYPKNAQGVILRLP
jgi:phosphohistidine phosphatase